MDVVETIVGLIFLVYCVYWIGLVIYFYTGTVIFVTTVGYIIWKYFKEDKTLSKVDSDTTPKNINTESVKVSPSSQITPKTSNTVKVTSMSPNPNPYTLEELQNHLDAYRQKAINSGKKDKWKYGRDYERYIGYLWEKDGYKVIYNGAVEGNFDGGIDLICYKGNKCCLIQCKRWKNNVGEECIERFYDAVERFRIYNSGCDKVEGFFYTTSDYTGEAYDVAWEYDIDCCVEEFDSIREYPPVKCLVRNGEKIYYLPFDKEFDKISVENGCDYKFKIADAEKAGYHYYLNRDVILKTPTPVSKLKKQSDNEWYYWNGNKNYPVGYFHAGFVEFVDLRSCKINSYIDGCSTFSAKYLKVSPFAEGHTEGTRVFRYFKDFPFLPEVYENNYWVSIPSYRELQTGEGYLSYIENQKMYAYTMFKIVHYKIFGEEYNDSCKYGWHYDKGYPEYRS